MPFFKYIIETKGTDKHKVSSSLPEVEKEFDAGYFINQRMVNIISHLSQLIKIAEDIFGTIEIEIRNVHERTSKLNVKIQHCQEIVDNLNAKAVKVPIGSLTGNHKTYLRFKSCDAEEIRKAPIFSRFSRPSAVEKLRNLAQGPSPPVIIPSGMVASEVDGFSGTISGSKQSSTHIYCKPGKINYDKSRVSTESGDSHDHEKNTPSVKVPSSVVPIDVSGQSFSRMSSFRRSLIHVDFLMKRKKKKDKRRNTVAEGDVKELKDALHKMVSDEGQFALPNGICTYQQIITESKNGYNLKAYDNQLNEKNSVEQNNNAANVKSLKKDTNANSTENQIIHEEKCKNALNGSEGLRKELKLNEVESTTRHLSSSKRKAKSHIPISTVSAAMNVAVEMRQCNGIREEAPVLNGVCNNTDHNSSDSDNKLQEDKRNSNSSCNEDGSQDESWTSYKKRLQDKCRTLANRKVSSDNGLMKKEIEVSSSASSENIESQDNAISAVTSTDSDTFFISSDESDEDSSEVTAFQENYGSSTSIGTASDGSLNSLLSETGTELTSSTGTLTSVGHEHLLISPPPPPPMILSATVRDIEIMSKAIDLPCTRKNTAEKNKRCVKAETVIQKQVKQPKPSKSRKSDIFDLQRRTENSKNIFTSLVSLKTHSKDKNKSKSKEVEKKRLNKNNHQLAFDMYGNNSPTKTKQIPAFIKENVSPVIKHEEKSCMKSFLTSDKVINSVQIPDNEEAKKSKPDCLPQRKISCSDDKNSSDMTKTKEIQTIRRIPSKYEHQVTVTPVQRCTDNENRNLCQKGSFVAENPHNLRCGNLPRSGFVNTESQVCAPRSQRPHPPTTLQQHDRTKLAARVVLDFDGKVIYTTNSLDRKQCIPGHAVNMYSPVQNKTHDPYFKYKQVNSDNSYCNSCQENYVPPNYQRYPGCNSNTAYSQINATTPSCRVPINYNLRENGSENEHYSKKDIYSIKQPHAVSCIQSPQSRMPENIQPFMPKRTDIRPFSYAGNSSDAYFSSPSNNLLPDPNISGLPVQETMLTRHNVNLHSKQMEKMNTNDPENTFKRISDGFCISPSSQTNNTDILNKSPQSTMSTEDLFAVIHDCKKRMNIKTDSDISLASSSSRSSSPSYLRPSSSKGTLAETGFLSPRNHVHLETSGDRRSWADFRPVKDSHERKSLASDRLGPTKPTSMHDFKMLLLQARTSSQVTGPRKSAVEMLKVPLNQVNTSSAPPPPLSLNLSPRNSISFSAQNSPTVEMNLYNGHSTVPFKRGNRVRTSLQSRYIMYPPIFEDCSEESENCGDIISDKSATNIIGIGNANNKENSDWRYESSNDRSIQSDQEYSCDSERNLQSE